MVSIDRGKRLCLNGYRFLYLPPAFRTTSPASFQRNLGRCGPPSRSQGTSIGGDAAVSKKSIAAGATGPPVI